jgi:uncharacterized membrane protein
MKKYTKKDISRYVELFKTKYKEGFTEDEINQVVKDFGDDLNIGRFYNAQNGITAMMIDEKIITYKIDIEHALRSALFDRPLTTEEFD